MEQTFVESVGSMSDSTGNHDVHDVLEDVKWGEHDAVVSNVELAMENAVEADAAAVVDTDM